MPETRSSRLADILWPVMAGLWLAVFPLWQDGSFTRITRAKWLGMLILAGVCAACVAAVVILALVRREKIPLKLNGLHAVVLVYLAWMGVSAAFAPLSGLYNDRGEVVWWMGALRYEGLATQLCYGLICSVMALRPLRLKPVLHAAAAALMIFFAVVMMQYAGLNPLGLFPEGRSVRTNYEFQGTIGNIDMISGYLSIVVPLLLGGFATARRGGWPWLLAGLLGVELWLMIEVQSGIIALMVGMALLLLALLRWARMRRRCEIILAGVLLCVLARGMINLPWLDGGETVSFAELGGLRIVALLMIAAVMMIDRFLPNRDIPGRTVAILTGAAAVMGLAVFLMLPLSSGGLWEIRETLLGRGEDAYGSYRLGVWRYTLAIAGEHPLVGTGPDTFLYALRRHLADIRVRLPETFDNPHNEYLAMLVNCGVPALAAYLTLLGMKIRRCCRQKQGAILAAVICYGVQGIFSFSICLVSPMWWAVLGMEDTAC